LDRFMQHDVLRRALLFNAPIENRQYCDGTGQGAQLIALPTNTATGRSRDLGCATIQNELLAV
jgi:hypothetical protein